MPALSPRDRLRGWVAAQLSSLPPGARLPNSSTLAARFGLSAKTVNTALKPLVASGELVRVRGKGTFVPGASDMPGPGTVDRPRSSPERIVDALKQSIAAGDLKFGDPLPPVTFMSRQFHVSPSTVTAAYRLLAAQRYAVRVGRSYWIGAFKGMVNAGTHKEVCLVHLLDEGFDRHFAHDLYTLSYGRMERELASLGYVLRVLPARDLRARAKRWTVDRRPPFGIVLYNVNASQCEDLLGRVLEALGTARRQVEVPILLDLRSSRHQVRVRSVHTLHRGNLSTSTGKAVARFVVERGYRSAAFFFDENLRATESTFWNFVRILKIRIELANLCRDTRVRFVARPHGRTLSPTGFIEAEVRANHRYSPTYLQALLGKYHQLSIDDVLAELSTTTDFADTWRAHTDADIWVFSRMRDAVRGMAWCRDNRIRVPQRVSVLSLENDPAFISAGVSCCDIDWDTLGYLMAHAVAGDIPIARTSRGYIRCSARVITRQSTR